MYLFSLIVLEEQNWEFLGHSVKHYSEVNKIGGWLEDERPVSVHSTFSLCCWNVTNINCYCSAVLHYINICVNSHCEYTKCFDGQRGEFPHVLVSSLYEATALCALTELSHSCCSASAWVLSSLFSSFVNGLLTESSSVATQQFPSKCSKPTLQNFFFFFFKLAAHLTAFLCSASFIILINAPCKMPRNQARSHLWYL